MVVAGRVTEMAKSDKGPTYISEHDPDWHEATIDIDEVVKGKKDIKQVKVLFPNSDDVRWHKIGKYAPGQQGVWLLHPGQQQDTKGIPAKVMAAVPAGPDVLTALHPSDYLPLHELERVRAMISKYNSDPNEGGHHDQGRQHDPPVAERGDESGQRAQHRRQSGEPAADRGLGVHARARWAAPMRRSTSRPTAATPGR